MVAWLARATAVLRFGSQTPMVFNTALALAVTGAALAYWPPRRPWAALVAGVFDTALGLAVLAEYLLGRGLGIDQLIVNAYVSGPASVPGRPAVNTAVCLAASRRGAAGVGPVAVPQAARRAGRGRICHRCYRDRSDLRVRHQNARRVRLGAPERYGLPHRRRHARPGAHPAERRLARDPHAARWLSRVAPHARRCAGSGAGVRRVAGCRWPERGCRTDPRRHRRWRGHGPRACPGRPGGGGGLAGAAVGPAAPGGRGARRARAEAKAQARDGENRLFQFLDAMPVGVFVASPGGRPYYANRESERVLGRGVVPATGGSGLAETYGVFVAGTDRLYPAESMPIVRALRGQSSHLDDQEIHQPDGAVIPIEIWGRPVYGAGGKVELRHRRVRRHVRTQRQRTDHRRPGRPARTGARRDLRAGPGRPHHVLEHGRRAHLRLHPGRGDGRVVHHMLRTEFPEPLAGIEATMARDGRWEGELSQRRADGRTIVTQSRWAAQRGTDGSLLGFMEVNRDITARKDAEREMRRQLGGRTHPAARRRADHFTSKPLGRAARTRRVPAGVHGGQPGHHGPQRRRTRDAPGSRRRSGR